MCRAGGQLAAAVLNSASLEVFGQVPLKQLREDSLTDLNLNGKALGPTEAIVIAELVKVNAVLTTLDLRVNKIGPTGATALAETLKVNAVAC